MSDVASPKPNDVFQWIKPHWLLKKEPTEENPEGGWPWVDDEFLAAVETVDKDGKHANWLFYLLSFNEDGNLFQNCDPFGDWDQWDIEWIAKIPKPPVK